MNIDLLESNPPWWTYIPLALGTLSLTLIVWLTFKFNRDVSISWVFVSCEPWNADAESTVAGGSH